MYSMCREESSSEGADHGLIKYKDNRTKCRLYWCFNRVYRLEIQSFRLVFSTQLCELMSVYTDTVCLGGGGGFRAVLEIIFWRS
jgi:hypothetical protein